MSDDGGALSDDGGALSDDGGALSDDGGAHAGGGRPLSPVLAGAQPWSHDGANGFGVLVLHGLTGNPGSVRGWAEAFAAAGFSVELPLLPGHGTSMDDLVTTSWGDWSAHAEQVLDGLAARSRGVVVAGLSMGGTLTAWLATRRPEILGIVLVNGALEPFAESFLDILRGAVEGGVDRIAGIGSDIADPDAQESSYDGTALVPVLSLAGACAELAPRLGRIRCPSLVLTSPQDHIVPPSASDFFAQHTGGPVERVTLERSYHVATLDYDKDIVFGRSVAFAHRVTGA